MEARPGVPYARGLVMDPAGPKRRTRRRAAIALVALVVTLTASLAWARRRLDVAIRDGLRDSSQRLGRTFSVTAITARLTPSLDVTLTGLTVGAAAGAPSPTPLLSAASLRVRLSLWTLLRSKGRDLVIDEIELRNPTLTVTLLPDGRSSLDDLRARRGPPRRSNLTSLRIARVSLRSGALDLIDASNSAGPLTLSLRSLDAVCEHIGPARGSTLRLSTAALGATKNLRANVSLGPLTVRDGAVVAPAVSAVELAYDRVETAPLFELAARRRATRMTRGAFTGITRVELDARARPRRLATSFTVSGLVVRRREGGVRDPVEASLDAEVSLDHEAHAIAVPIFHATLDGMSLSGDAQLAMGERPELRALSLSSTAITLERLEPWLPPHDLPAGAVLEGPLTLRARGARAADGSTGLSTAIDLTGATIRVPDWIHKPAGTVLSAQFEGSVRDGDVTVDRAGVTLGPLVVALHGAVRSARAFDLSFDSGEVPIDPLLRLLPRVRAEVPADVALHGRLRASGELRTENSAHAGRLRIALRGADVRTPTLTLTGEADASLTASVSHDRVTAEASLDAGRARVMIAGRIDKAAGAPMRLYARGTRTGRRVEVASFTAQLPGAHVDASGAWDASTHRATLRMPTFEVDLARLLPVLPDGGPRVPGALATATMHGGVTFEGDLDALQSAHLHVDGIELRSEAGDLHGSFDATGLDEPRRLRFDLWGGALDAERITRSLPPTSDARANPPAWWSTADIEGSLRADSLRLTSQTLSSPRAELTLRDGRLTARTLSLGVFNGSLRADGSTLERAGATQRVSAHVRAQRIDMFALATAMGTEISHRPTGSLDVEADLSTSGADPDALKANLEGRLRLSGINVVMRHVASPSVSVVLPVVGARPAGSGPQRDPSQPLTIRSFDVTARLERGVIRTTSALRMETDTGSVTLSGRVNSDQTLALSGQIRIPAEVIERATHGDRLITTALPVSIAVSGRVGAPEVQVTDLSATLAVLAGSRLRAIARGLFQ